MDPKANIEEQLKLAKSILTTIDEERALSWEDCDRLAELVIALHEWQLKGGFSPYSK